MPPRTEGGPVYAAPRRPLRVTPLFTQLGEFFVAGRLREMTAFWTFPCPVEMNGDLVVMRAPELLEMFFAARLAEARAVGLAAMVPRVIAVEMPRRGRFRVWLRWSYRFRDRTVEDQRVTLYFMAVQPWGRLSIEMMDLVPEPGKDS